MFSSLKFALKLPWKSFFPSTLFLPCRDSFKASLFSLTSLQTRCSLSAKELASCFTEKIDVYVALLSNPAKPVKAKSWEFLSIPFSPSASFDHPPGPIPFCHLGFFLVGMPLSIPVATVLEETTLIFLLRNCSILLNVLLCLACSPIYSLYCILKDILKIQNVTSLLKTLQWLPSCIIMKSTFLNAAG